mmetsp:Transcript_91144/g.237466  ORF Transcript_91144/g.237466 Transcript_91144/m.237466 type:complete len:287 (-) Transcript_91144:130-990(-)
MARRVRARLPFTTSGGAAAGSRPTCATVGLRAAASPGCAAAGSPPGGAGSRSLGESLTSLKRDGLTTGPASAAGMPSSTPHVELLDAAACCGGGDGLRLRADGAGAGCLGPRAPTKWRSGGFWLQMNGTCAMGPAARPGRSAQGQSWLQPFELQLKPCPTSQSIGVGFLLRSRKPMSSRIVRNSCSASRISFRTDSRPPPSSARQLFSSRSHSGFGRPRPPRSGWSGKIGSPLWSVALAMVPSSFCAPMGVMLLWLRCSSCMRFVRRNPAMWPAPSSPTWFLNSFT